MESATHAHTRDRPDRAAVNRALASITQGGYAAACARAVFLLACNGAPPPLSWIPIKGELVADYRGLLPAVTPARWRSIMKKQEIFVRHAREQAISTLPELLPVRTDRKKLLALLARMLADQRVQNVQTSPEQYAMLARIGKTLNTP